MDITRTAFGAWNGGRFMNFGEPLPDERWILLVRHAFERGIRTFITADVYGAGAADELLAKSLSGIPRDEYCLVGAVGHDFYKGQRQAPAAIRVLPILPCARRRSSPIIFAWPRKNPCSTAAPTNSIFCSCTIPIPSATAATGSGRA